MIVLYLLGYYFTWLSARKVMSMHFISVSLMLPAVLVADEQVKLIMSTAIFFQGLGSWSFNIIKKIKIKNRLKNYKKTKLTAEKIAFVNIHKFLKIIFIISFLLSSYYFYIVGISLFAEEVGLARLLNRHDVFGSFIFQRIFRLVMPITCLIYYLLQFSDETKKYYNNNFFFIMVISTIAFLLFTGIRGNVITFMLIPFVLMMGYLESGGRVRKQVTYIVLFAFIAFLIVTSLMSPDLNLIDLIFLIMERLGGGATDGITYAVLYDIPSNGYYYGKTYLNDVLSLFSKTGIIGIPVQNYSAYIASELLGNNYNGEQAAVTVYGEFFANFGIFGVVLCSYLLGSFLQFVYIYIMKKPKTIFNLAFYAYIQSAFLMILGGPTLSMLIDYSISIFAFYALILLLKKKHVGGFKHEVQHGLTRRETPRLVS